MTDRLIAINMSFQLEYAERFDWLNQPFMNWAFNASTYHIALLDKPTLVWDFYALLLASFMQSDEEKPCTCVNSA